MIWWDSRYEKFILVLCIKQPEVSCPRSYFEPIYNGHGWHFPELGSHYSKCPSYYGTLHALMVIPSQMLNLAQLMQLLVMSIIKVNLSYTTSTVSLDCLQLRQPPRLLFCTLNCAAKLIQSSLACLPSIVQLCCKYTWRQRFVAQVSTWRTCTYRLGTALNLPTCLAFESVAHSPQNGGPVLALSFPGRCTSFCQSIVGLYQRSSCWTF